MSNGGTMWRRRIRRINGSTAINCWPAGQPVKCAHGSFVDYVAYASSVDTCMTLISSVCCISCCISCTRLDHLTRVWPWCWTRSRWQTVRYVHDLGVVHSYFYLITLTTNRLTRAWSWCCAFVLLFSSINGKLLDTCTTLMLANCYFGDHVIWSARVQPWHRRFPPWYCYLTDILVDVDASLALTYVGFYCWDRNTAFDTCTSLV